MTPSIDLVLATLERALSVTILPTATNASAKEEASLGVLFMRWLRDVVDHAADAERASETACRRAAADVAGIFRGSPSLGGASAGVASEVEAALAKPRPETIAGVREEGRRWKALLGRSLRAAREDGDEQTSHAIRLRLFDLAGGEIERERAFGRSTGMDPDAASLPALADLVRPQSGERSEG